MKSEDFKITVPGTDFVIKSNTIYTVIPKPDPNAPDGFKEYGTTKIIHPLVGDVITAPFDTAMGVWDTGFYEHSPCLRGINAAEVRAHLANVHTHLVEPVEKLKGKGALDHSEKNDFFDKFVVNLSNKTVFNTADPLQRLMLYVAVLGKQLAPKEHVGNPAFKFAAYQVVNRDREITNKQQSEIDSSKATGEFYVLLKRDKDKLVKIFKYLGISSTLIQDESTFITVFNKYMQDKTDGYRNGKIFLEHVEKFNSEKGENELNVFSLLSDLADKGIIKIVRKEFYFQEVNLGNTLKHAATKVVNDPKLHAQIVNAAADLERPEIDLTEIQ